MRKTALLLGMLILSTHASQAQIEERFDARQSGTDTPTQVFGSGIGGDLIFAGTSQNGPGGNNDVFLIDPAIDTFSSLLAGVPVWGATFDAANQRILYTTEAGTDSAVEGSPLYEVPLASGVPNLVGVINDGAGTDFRIDGLAMSGGVLYGARAAAAAAADGIYIIDLGTMSASLQFAFTDSISGIDADPDTGVIYGVNDTTGQLVSIDVAGNIITNIAAYPDANETDIDGLAVGGGRAYLVPDDSAPGLIYVYDFATDSYVTPLTAPWGAVDDTFSGAAYTGGNVLPEPVAVPLLDSYWAILFGLALIIGAHQVMRRRQPHNR